MTTGPDEEEEVGVAFERTEDGSVIASDLETGLARSGETRTDAMAALAEALERHEGEEPVEDEDETGSGPGLHPDGLDSWCR